jgi:hypothetical protein
MIFHLPFFILWIYVYSSGQLFGFVFIQKDRFMLWIGIASICFSIYTIRFYHSVPIEIALTIGGLVLFAFTFFAIKD